MVVKKKGFGGVVQERPVHPAIPILVCLTIIGLVIGVIFRQQLGLPLSF